MPYSFPHLYFDWTGSFKFDVKIDLPNFPFESDDPDVITYNFSPIQVWFIGNIPNFPTVDLGNVNRYSFGHFYLLSETDVVIYDQKLTFLYNSINQGRGFDFSDYNNTGSLNAVRKIALDTPYTNIISRVYFLKSIFVPNP